MTGEDNRKPGSFWRAGAIINAALSEIGEEYKPDFSQDIASFDDIYLNAGKMLTQDLKTAPILPLYVQLGFNVRIC